MYYFVDLQIYIYIYIYIYSIYIIYYIYVCVCVTRQQCLFQTLIKGDRHFVFAIFIINLFSSSDRSFDFWM